MKAINSYVISHSCLKFSHKYEDAMVCTNIIYRNNKLLQVMCLIKYSFYKLVLTFRLSNCILNICQKYFNVGTILGTLYI